MAIDYVLETSLKLRDNFSTTLNSASKKFKKFGANIAENTRKIDRGFNKIAIGSGALATGLFAGAWKVYGSYRELNTQLIRNQALMGASETDSKKLEAQVKKLGKSTIFTAKQVAEAQEKQIMAGYNTQQILETTPSLLKLSVAAGEDLTRTSDIITDSLTAFGLKTKDLNDYLDVLVKTATSTNTNIGMLGNAFQSVASSSRTFGESYKEVALMLGLLADNGIKAEKAGVALRGIYAKLSKPTDDMRKALSLTNTKIYDQNGKFRGLRKIIVESKKALQELTPEQRNMWLTTVAGTRGMSAWSSIMNTSSERMSNLENSTYHATGALDDFNMKMSKADEITLKKLESAWDDVKISLGKALSPLMLEKMTQFTNYLSKLSDSGVINSDNINKLFGDIEGKVKKAVAVFATLKLSVLGVRAAAGDPIAIAQLTALGVAGAVAGGAYVGKKIGDFVGKNREKTGFSFSEMQEGNDEFSLPKGNYGATVPREKMNFADYSIFKNFDLINENIGDYRHNSINVPDEPAGNLGNSLKNYSPVFPPINLNEPMAPSNMNDIYEPMAPSNANDNFSFLKKIDLGKHIKGYEPRVSNMNDVNEPMAPSNEGYGPRIPTVNVNMNNVTFNNGNDIDKFTSDLISKLQARE